MTDNKKPIILEEKSRIVITVKLFLIMLAIFIPSLTGIYINNQIQHKALDLRIQTLELRMNRIESKLDLIMQMSGIDPNSDEVKDYLYAQQHKEEAIQILSYDIAQFLSDNINNFKIMLTRPADKPTPDN